MSFRPDQADIAFKRIKRGVTALSIMITALIIIAVLDFWFNFL